MIGETKKNVKKLVCAAIVGLVAFAGASEARAGLIFENIPVITEPGFQRKPDVWGNYIVWSGRGNTVYDISQRQLVEMPGLPTRIDMFVNKIAIYGNKVIWEGSTGYYDIDLQKMVYPEGLFIGRRPAIYNNKIVWEDSTGYYDLSSEQMIYPPSLSIGHSPDIFEDKIVWFDLTGYYDIHLQQMVYLEGLLIGSMPAIHDNKIVWQGAPGYYDINLQQTVYLEDVDYIVLEPDIFEDTIVWWTDGPGTGGNIFMWDPIIGTTQITECALAYKPQIYNDIVVWNDFRDGEWNIYMAVIPEPSTIVLFGTGLAALLHLGKRRRTYH